MVCAELRECRGDGVTGSTPCCVEICYYDRSTGDEGAQVEGGLDSCWFGHFYTMG